MKYVVDTNVLLNLPESLDKYEIIITSMVLRELEKHKLSSNQELAYKARRATRYIRENEDRLEFDTLDYGVNLGSGFDPNYVDNQIIQCCLSRKCGLITNDLLLRFKAKTFNVEVVSIDEVEELYQGYKVICVNDDEMAQIYERPEENNYGLVTNQYLIIRDKSQDCKTVDIKRWDGEKLVDLRQPPKKVVNPLNDLQRCAVDLLYNKNIPIKAILGTYGSGKTLLSVKMGLWHVKEKGNYSSITMIRNPLGKGEEIGYLPGDKEEKIGDFFRPITQHLEGGIFEEQAMKQNGQLIAEIPYYMKGLSIGSSYIIVDEAEDLDVDLIKLIGTRPEKDSVIVFSGDYKQAEHKYKHNNGLLKMVNAFKGNPLFGVVVLDLDVRSDASKLFADL